MSVAGWTPAALRNEIYTSESEGSYRVLFYDCHTVKTAILHRIAHAAVKSAACALLTHAQCTHIDQRSSLSRPATSGTERHRAADIRTHDVPSPCALHGASPTIQNVDSFKTFIQFAFYARRVNSIHFAQYDRIQLFSFAFLQSFQYIWIVYLCFICVSNSCINVVRRNSITFSKCNNKQQKHPLRLWTILADKLIRKGSDQQTKNNCIFVNFIQSCAGQNDQHTPKTRNYQTICIAQKKNNTKKSKRSQSLYRVAKYSAAIDRLTIQKHQIFYKYKTLNVRRCVRVLCDLCVCWFVWISVSACARLSTWPNHLTVSKFVGFIQIQSTIEHLEQQQSETAAKQQL